MGTEYMEQYNWIWNGNTEGNDCNAKLISAIGKTVCIRNSANSVYAEIVDTIGDEPTMQLHFDGDHEDWSAIYHLMGNDGDRMCRYLLSNDLCFERLGENQFVITAERSNML